jgi:hypothetical protein
MNDFNREIWERLTSDPTILQLDFRVDEEPEDKFIRVSQSGRRSDIVSALRELLSFHVIRQPAIDLEIEARFLKSAFRLCDALQADDCKSALKLFLLEGSPDRWGNYFEPLQEVAARALLSLKREPQELTFWSDVALMRRQTCPYALNAALEINLARGLELLGQISHSVSKEALKRLLDLEAILELARDFNGEKKFRKAAAEFLKAHPEQKNSPLHLKLESVAGLSKTARGIELSEFTGAVLQNLIHRYSEYGIQGTAGKQDALSNAISYRRLHSEDALTVMMPALSPTRFSSPHGTSFFLYKAKSRKPLFPMQFSQPTTLLELSESSSYMFHR